MKSAESLGKLLTELKTREAEVQGKLDRLEFTPDLNSLSALVKGYEAFKNEKDSLLHELEVLRNIKPFVEEAVKEAESIVEDKKKTRSSLKRKENRILKSLRGELPNTEESEEQKELDPVARANLLRELAKIRSKINAEEAGRKNGSNF